MLMPIAVAGGRRAIRRDLLFGLIPAVVLLALCWSGRIDRQTAGILIAIFVAFMTVCLMSARRQSAAKAVVGGHPARHVALTVVGIAALLLGAELMVRGGVSLARSSGVSETVIGLTLVAFGTSLPELAASVAAALKRESELSVGNVLGSNVFNLGLIVGTAFMIRPGQVPTFVIHHDIPILVMATALVGLVILRDGRIERREGAAMLGLFAAYVLFLVWRGGGS
jgi:cation:H+ antiporter